MRHMTTQRHHLKPEKESHAQMVSRRAAFDYQKAMQLQRPMQKRYSSIVCERSWMRTMMRFS